MWVGTSRKTGLIEGKINGGTHQNVSFNHAIFLDSQANNQIDVLRLNLFNSISPCLHPNAVVETVCLVLFLITAQYLKQ